MSSPRPTPERSSSSSRKLQDIFSTLQDLDLAGQIKDQEREQLGLGSSCDVFRAWSTKHEKKVAVKRIRCFLLDDISFANSLGREVRLWSKLAHENVLPLLGYFLEGQKALPNLVSEWMEDGTVIDYVKGRPLDVFELCKMVYGIAAGLNYLHVDCSMIHADLKGSNIFVSSEGRPLLADFGLSVSTTLASLGATTLHGQKGSLRWMAKELHSSDAAMHTTITDIWSFRMVISELLTQKIPYESIPDRNVPAAILGGQLPEEPDWQNTPKRHGLHVLWTIAQNCWRTDPKSRPSATDLMKDIGVLIAGLDAGKSSTDAFTLARDRDVAQLKNELREHEKDIETRDVKATNEDLETVEYMRARLRMLEEDVDKYKEENWNLEVTLQELQSQLTMGMRPSPDLANETLPLEVDDFPTSYLPTAVESRGHGWH